MSSHPQADHRGFLARLREPSQEKRDAQRRPCPRPLQQPRSLCCSGLATSTTLTVILGRDPPTLRAKERDRKRERERENASKDAEIYNNVLKMER